MATSTPIQPLVTPLNGAAAASVVWRSRGQLHATVIAKATFAFAPEADMHRVEPQPILHEEVYHDNNPARSLRYGSDLAPYLPRADVLFTGHAYAEAPGPAHARSARLAIFRDEKPILDKTILIQSAKGSQRLSITYENAFGGPSVLDNPFGLGETSDEGEPSILDPANLRRPIGFGPIARTWPARKRLLGAVSRKSLEGPVAEIPDPFDWSYFQTAPLDQRTDFLRGDEWIVLQGLHPDLPLLRTRLPNTRGLAHVHGLSAFGVAEGQPLELHADTLRIDGEAKICTLVFRRSFSVSAEDALAAAHIVVGVESSGAPLTWPARPSEIAALAARTPGSAGLAASGTEPDAEAETLTRYDDTIYTPPPPILPFRQGTAPEAIAVRRSPEEQTPPVAPPISDTASLPSQTLAISPAQEGLASRQPIMPFLPASAGIGPPLPAVEVYEHVGSGTLTLSPAQEDRASSQPMVPFLPAHAGVAPLLPNVAGDEHVGSRTLPLSPAQEDRASHQPVMPFVPAPAGAAPSLPAVEVHEHVGSGTLTLSPAQEDRASHQPVVPFVPAPAGAAPSLPDVEVHEHVSSGAPALLPEDDADRAPQPDLPSSPPPTANESEPSLAAPPVEEPPPAVVQGAKGAPPVYTPHAHEPQAAPPPPSPQRPVEPPALPVPSPSLKRGLYERFRRG